MTAERYIRKGRRDDTLGKNGPAACAYCAQLSMSKAGGK